MWAKRATFRRDGKRVKPAGPRGRAARPLWHDKSQSTLASLNDIITVGKPVPEGAPEGNVIIAGSPYDPVCHSEMNGPDLIGVLQLPNSIWSSAMVAPILTVDGEERFDVLLPQLIGLVLTCTVQILVTQFLHDIVLVAGFEDTVTHHTEQESVFRGCGEKHNYALRFVCVFALVANVFKDILQTVDMARWVHQIPNWDEAKHSTLLDELDNECGIAVRNVTDCEGNKTTEFATGVTFRYRIYVWLCILIPKLAIANALQIYASRYVSYATTNEQLVTNSVAVLFILDMDDHIYDLLNTSYLKRYLLNLPAIGVPQHKATRFDATWEKRGFYIALGAVMYTTLVSSNIWCTSEFTTFQNDKGDLPVVLEALIWLLIWLVVCLPTVFTLCFFLFLSGKKFDHKAARETQTIRSVEPRE